MNDLTPDEQVLRQIAAKAAETIYGHHMVRDSVVAGEVSYATDGPVRTAIPIKALLWVDHYEQYTDLWNTNMAED